MNWTCFWKGHIFKRHPKYEREQICTRCGEHYSDSWLAWDGNE